MDSDPLDLSIGLAPSLELLRRYKKSGILQASVTHIPGMRDEGLARLHLVNGEVVACEVIRRDGQAHSISKERLMQLDEERGPFEWVLHAQPALSPYPQTDPLLSSSQADLLPPMPMPSYPPSLFPPAQADSARPVRVKRLDVRQLEGWSSKDRMIFYAVYSLIDDYRTVGEIKARSSLSSETIDDVLRVLKQISVITFM